MIIYVIFDCGDGCVSITRATTPQAEVYVPVIDDLYSADLNLLVVFAALMRERNVTRCASRLAVGQSTISASLGRLRILFKDPLFIRMGRQMRPTDKAVKLASLIGPALDLIDAALVPGHEFSPATCQEAFRIEVVGGLCVSWVLNLCSTILASAPAIAVSVGRTASFPLGEQADLENDVIEVGYFSSHRAGMNCETLVNCHGLLLRSHGSEEIKTMSDLAARRHILVPFGDGKEGLVDRVLFKHGLARHVAMSLPTVDGATDLIAESDLVLIAPDIELYPYHDLRGIVVQPLPPEAQVAFELRMAWPSHKSTTAGQRWLRAQVRERVRALAPLAPPARIW